MRGRVTPFADRDLLSHLVPLRGAQHVDDRYSPRADLIEARLGLPEASRIQFDSDAIEKRLSAADRAKLVSARTRPTILALLDTWLARTPFLDWGGESFRVAYRAAVVRHLSADVETISADVVIPAERREREKSGLDKALERFAAIFDLDANRDAPRRAPLWAPRWPSGAVRAWIVQSLVWNSSAPALARR